MKKYEVVLSERFKREFRKFDKYTQNILRSWINNNIVDCKDPRLHGKSLTGDMKGLWRYRIGDYRMICEIRDDELVILAITIGHRRKVYDQQRYLHEETEADIDE